LPYKDKEVLKIKRREWYKRTKEIRNAYFREYEMNNNDKLREQRRLTHVKRKYNLEASDYLSMINYQENKCAICHLEETYTTKYGDIRPLSVDHSHITGKVRELLCTRCNSMLGYVNDNPEILQSAIKYLKKHSGE